MPSDKPPTVSFNQWLSLQRSGPYAALAAKWQVRRGRLTRESVIERAGDALAGVAGAAWDAYAAAVGLPGCRPPVDPGVPVTTF